jgi:DNA repair protein RecO (recombination protein O)
MIESAAGIILRIHPLTETSLITDWLTPNLGRVATVAKGARRPKSPFLGKLDLFYEADFSFSRSRRGDLHILREVGLRKTNGALREDLLKVRQAAYAAGFIAQTTEAETPLPAIFELFREFLETLCLREPSAQQVFAFELKMLRELGLAPNWDKTSLTAGTKKIANALLQRNFTTSFGLKLADTQINELRKFLHGFLIFHLGKAPRGRAQALANENNEYKRGKNIGR